MQKTALYSFLLSLSFALAPAMAFGAGQEGDIDKLLDKRLNSETAGEVQREQAALAKQARMDALVKGEQVLKNVEELKTVINNWEKRIQTLLTGPEGKGIANDPTAVKQFISVYEAKRMKAEEAQAIGNQVSELLKPVQTPSSPLYVPSEALVTRISKLGEQVEAELKNYSRLQTKLSVLLKSGGQRVGAGGGPTLEETITVFKEEEEKIDTERMEETTRKARDKARKDTEAQYVSMIPSKEEEAYLRELARKPEIQEQFSSFLAKGYTQIGPRLCHNPYRWHKVDRETAVSFKGMEKCKTFDNVKNYVRDESNKDNDRSKWPKPDERDEAAWQKAEKRLELFRKLAPIWLEMGLLAP